MVLEDDTLGEPALGDREELRVEPRLFSTVRGAEIGVVDLTVSTSENALAVRSAWIAMGQVTSAVIVPLAAAALVTGLVMSLGTKWGLFRHWWVLISLVLTVVALLVLWSETGLIKSVADLAADPKVSDRRLLAIPGTLPHSMVRGVATRSRRERLWREARERRPARRGVRPTPR